jgi:hypothetical protein
MRLHKVLKNGCYVNAGANHTIRINMLVFANDSAADLFSGGVAGWHFPALFRRSSPFREGGAFRSDGITTLP